MLELLKAAGHVDAWCANCRSSIYFFAKPFEPRNIVFECVQDVEKYEPGTRTICFVESLDRDLPELRFRENESTCTGVYDKNQLNFFTG